MSNAVFRQNFMSQTPGFYSRIFVVAKVRGGFRPVTDLSFLNHHITTKFRMETAQTVLVAVRRYDGMVSIDLKDSYLQVPVHHLSHWFPSFGWKGRA